MTKITYKQTGANFSPCGKYRFQLFRVWDETKPRIMFIGLNPSTANQATDDPTIRKIVQIANNLGFGSVYMLNCYPLVSTDPNVLNIFRDTAFHEVEDAMNSRNIEECARLCSEIVFAWGNFDVVRLHARDKEMLAKFPNAKALHINKNGSPKHPLYCKSNSILIPYNINIEGHSYKP